MLFTLNLLIIVFVLFIISIQLDKYNELVFDKYRFKYFALRDHLAMLVIRGEIKENSWEYQVIIDMLNFHIRVVEDMSIERLVAALIRYHLSPEKEKNIYSINDNTDNKEVLMILAEFMETTKSLIACNSKTQLWILKNLTGKIHRPQIVNSPEINAIKDSRQAIENISGIHKSLVAKIA